MQEGGCFYGVYICKANCFNRKRLPPPTVLTGNLESIRTIADVRDAVRAYFLLVTNKNIPSGSVFNIGGTFTTSVGSILEKLISLSTVDNIKHAIDESRLRPIDADLQIPDTSQFRKYTKWEPKYSFEETMNSLLSYWRELVDKNGNVYLQR